MPRRGSILLTTANEIGSALVDKLGGSGYAPVEWDKKINIMGISSEDIPDALDNLIPSEGGGDRGSILISKANEIGAVLNKKFNTDRGFKPKEWASAISKLTPLQVKTASGAIASFPDGADAVPLTSLVCDINPKQDLHGYSKPWAPGAGKNKMPDKTYQRLPANLRLGTDTLDGRMSLPAGTYTLSLNCNLSSGNSIYYVLEGGSAVLISDTTSDGVIYGSFTLSADTTNIFFYIYNGSGVTAENVSNLQLESGSSPTSFEPYSNVCPIEGSTQTTAYQFGKNLVDGSKRFQASRTLVLGQTDNTSFSIFLKAGTYTISYTTSATASYIYRREENDTSNTNMGRNTSATFTTTKDGYYRLWLYGDDALDEYISNVQLELGSTAHAYEAFKQKTPVVAQFGETIYGGYVDIVTGILTLTNALKIFAGEESEGWGTYPAYNGFYAEITDMKSGTRLDGLSNMLVKSTTSAQGQTNAFWLGANNNRIYVIGVYESIANTLAKFKEFLSTHNLIVTYPLATPIEIDLEDPQEVESYLGYNNIYNDTGDTSASYYADIDLNNV